jgi:hypothetical protein
LPRVASVLSWDEENIEHVNSLEGGNALAAKYPGSKIELTLTPRGPLNDGSTGKVVTLSRDPKGQVYGRPVLDLDIPLGSYTVTARIIEANGTAHPLRVVLGGKGTPTLTPSANLDFAPHSSYGTDNASLVLGEYPGARSEQRFWRVGAVREPPLQSDRRPRCPESVRTPPAILDRVVGAGSRR